MTFQHLQLLFILSAPAITVLGFLCIWFRLTRPGKNVFYGPKEISAEVIGPDDDDEEFEEDDRYDDYDSMGLYDGFWFFVEICFAIEFLLFPFLPLPAIQAYTAPALNALVEMLEKPTASPLVLMLASLIAALVLLMVIHGFFNAFFRKWAEALFADFWRFVDPLIEKAWGRIEDAPRKALLSFRSFMDKKVGEKITNVVLFTLCLIVCFAPLICVGIFLAERIKL